MKLYRIVGIAFVLYVGTFAATGWNYDCKVKTIKQYGGMIMVTFSGGNAVSDASRYAYFPIDNNATCKMQLSMLMEARTNDLNITYMWDDAGSYTYGHDGVNYKTIFTIWSNKP
jgi:hypothetical protein